MPVTIKTGVLNYKDSYDQYVGVDVVADNTTASRVAAINSAANTKLSAIEQTGASTISQVETAVADSQAAVAGIDAQRNTMIAAIASVAGQGTDTTLSQSGVAADAKVVGDLKSALNKDEKALYSLKNDTTYQANASGFNEFPFHVMSGQKYKFENTSQSGAFGDIYSYTGTFSESTRHLISSGHNVAPGQYVEATAEYDDEKLAVYFGRSGTTIHVVATEAYLNTLDQRVEKNSYDINRMSLEKADTGITTLTRTDYTITDGRINSETGAVVDGESFKHVEIDVENFERISFVTAPQGLSTLHGCAFYDSNGTYISGVGFGTSEIDTNVFVDVPQGAKIWKYGFYNPWWDNSTYTTFIFYSTDQTIYGLQAQIDGIKGGVSAGIVSFGDSLTQGNQDGTGNTYPKYLTDLIGEAVYNAGVGGEDSLQIASRQGGISLFAKPFTIPSGTTPVSIQLECLEHDYVEPFHVITQANGGINPVEIGGVVGTLTFTGNWATQTYTYTFARNTAGDSVTLTRPTPIITATSKMRERVQIFWVGTNDYPHNLQTVQEKIVPRIDAMIAWTNAKNYLVIGLTAKVRFADLVDCNTYMQRHFGTRFIDISRYILQYGLQDESITPTAQDNTDIANGEIPTSLRTDSVHLNRYGYDIVAKQVYKRGQLLGYWE